MLIKKKKKKTTLRLMLYKYDKVYNTVLTMLIKQLKTTQ